MRKKIILNHIIVLLLFVALIFAFVLNTVYNMINSNIILVSGQAMTTQSDSFESILNFANSYMLQISTADAVQDELRRLTQNSQDDTALSIERDAQMQETFLEYIFNSAVTLDNIPFLLEITYKDQNENFVPVYYSYRQNQQAPSYYASNDEWVEELLTREGKFLWSTYVDNSNTYIRLSKIIYDIRDYSKVLGTISLDFSYNHIALNVINNLYNQSGINAAIVNNLTGEQIGYRTLNLPLDKNMLQSDYEYMLPSNKDYFYVRPLNGTSFSLVGIKPLQEAQDMFLNSALILLIVVGIVIGLAIILAFILGDKISKPIVQLSNTMKQVEGGNLKLSVSTDQNGEVGELYHSFNYMIDTINRLIDEKYISVINQKQLELSALQNQINTHFLYNTLETINWLAKNYNADDISYIVTNLSTLLRTSLNNGNPELTVEKELEHAKSYINIQNVRFKDNFTYTEDIDESVKNHKVIKMLIQPLVENAILHVFNNADNDKEDNRLIITIKKVDDYIMLQVSNNANPEDLDTIYNILAQTVYDKPTDNYGINSIMRRLKIAYDNNASYAYNLDHFGMLHATILIPCKYTSVDRNIVPKTVPL